MKTQLICAQGITQFAQLHCKLVRAPSFNYHYRLIKGYLTFCSDIQNEGDIEAMLLSTFPLFCSLNIVFNLINEPRVVCA